MSQNNSNKRIVNSVSLLVFARTYGPTMQVGEFTNKDSGEVFKSCVFTQPDGSRTFAAFSSNLGELSPAQIAAMKNELQVVTLDSGNHILCKQGQNTWQNVDLGL